MLMLYFDFMVLIFHRYTTTILGCYLTLLNKNEDKYIVDFDFKITGLKYPKK